jgi:hypothetical protein
MKKLTTLNIILSVICASLNGFSQSQTQSTGYFLNEVGMSASGSTIEVTQEGDTILVSDYSGQNLSLNTISSLVKKYKGTPYYRNKWFQGTATMKGFEPSPGLIGFNVVKSVIYYSPNKNIEAVEMMPKTFTLDGLVFTNFDDDFAGANNYYYNKVVDGEPMLLKQHSGRYTATQDDVDAAYGNSSTTEYVGKFEKFETYYFVVQKTLIKVSNKKSFIRSMGPYESRVKELISKNNLDLKDTKDIVKLAELLNQ